MDEYLSVYWATAIAVGLGILKGTEFICSTMPAAQRQKLSNWMKGEYQDSWGEIFGAAFDRVFDRKWTSSKFFMRSVLVTAVTSVLGIFILTKLLGASGEPSDPTGFTFLEMLYFAAIIGVINMVPDYMSILQTRWILSLITAPRTFLVRIALFVSDFLLTTCIGLIPLLLISASTSLGWDPLEFFFVDQRDGFQGGDRGAMDLTDFVDRLEGFGVFVVGFFFTYISSIWMLLFATSMTSMRFVRISHLDQVLDVEGQPARSFAIVCMTIYLLVAAVVWLFT